MDSTLALADIPSHTDSVSTLQIQLRPYQREDAKAFRELNEAWINHYFGLEEHDSEILENPDRYVFEPGGHIFLAFLKGRAIGCCALIPIEPNAFEVAKMAVAEEHRGHGVGRRLLAYVIEQARGFGATRLYLETNSRLVNAIHLYESLGFRHIPAKPSVFTRANVFMEQSLTKASS
jgi:putative acetyltransferase